MFHNWSSKNPFRLPNWRWERVRTLIEGTGPAFSRKRDDRWILRAYNFRKRLQRDDRPANCQLLAESFDFADIYWAADLWIPEAELKLSPPPRYAFKSELEARILAREPFEQIGRRMGLDAETITAYERLFFNVTERLDNESYIFHSIIGPSIHGTLTARDYGTIWKLFGYVMGPIMLDGLISTFLDPVRPERRSDLPGVVNDVAREELRRQGMVAAKTLMNNQASQLEILDRCLQQAEIDQESQGGTGAATEGMQRSVAAMLEAARGFITVGRRDSRLDIPELGQYYESAAELRTDELLSISFGRPALTPAELVAVGQEANAIPVAQDAPTEGADEARDEQGS